MKVLEPISKLRREHNLVKNFPDHMCGEELFGLTEPAILKVIESVRATIKSTFFEKYWRITFNTRQLISKIALVFHL